MSDQEAVILRRWVAHRDADAFAELLSRHAGMVYGACRRITRDAAAAEDLSQECFLKLAQQKGPIQAPGAWLHRVATCAALSWLRDEKRRVRRESDFAEAQAAAQEQVDPDWQSLVPLVDQAIDALPDKNRAAVILRFLEGKSHAQIGRELGVSRRAVQKRIDKGLEEIRATLGESVSGLTVAGLAGLLEIHMQAQAAPASLVAALGKQTIAATRFAAPVQKNRWITKGATIMTAKKTVALGIVLAVLVLGGIVLRREMPRIRMAGANFSGESQPSSAQPAAKQATNAKQPPASQPPQPAAGNEPQPATDYKKPATAENSDAPAPDKSSKKPAAATRSRP
ncbi:MAG: RNA polymerase sigma factor [Candidatus Hydrogenedentes bacterium]|nr:RNA polymerase sigma factor [Candidatus Hydrogenedentota bacterium]